MKKLIRKTEIPRANTHKELRAAYPGYQVIGESYGFSWPVHETKTCVVSMGFDTLVESVKAHIKANDAPISPNLERDMNEHACAQFPDLCAELDPDAERKVNLWYLAKRFFTAAITAASQGLVPQEEAERRAAICATCPNNQPMEAQMCVGCWSAKFVKEAAEALSARHTALDAQLDTCSLCQCSLKLKCHVPVEGMQEKEIQWPKFCWMYQEV